MKQFDPKIRMFARHIVAAELTNQNCDIKSNTAFLVCEKLRPQLTIFMGNAGFHALLSRALTLARADAGWLHQVNVKADGSLEGLEAIDRVASKEIAEGVVTLIARLLGLLVAFIGENLTQRLVGDVWPKISFADPDSKES